MERWLYKIALRLRSFVKPKRIESELEEEIRFHLEQQTDQNVGRGQTQEAARRSATVAFGGREQHKEACRDARGLAWVDHIARDVRYGARRLRANPGFASVALLSLALGIGANTAIFQLIDAVRLRRLPVPRPWELAEVRIAGGHRFWGLIEGPNGQLTYPIWEQIREHQRAFSGVFAWGTTPFIVGAGRDGRPASGMWVSGAAFEVLGIAPAAGRLLTAADDVRGCTPSVVLSYAFWQGQFGGDPSVIGRTLTVLQRALPIVGVASREFFGLEVGKRVDIVMPVCAAAMWGSQIDRRDWLWLSVMGRLNPGWTIEQAADQLHSLSPGFIEATLPSGRSAASMAVYRSFRLTAASAATGVSELRQSYGDALAVLLAITGLVLLIACTNLMNLLLARASAREQEIAVRVAIGASRGRVVAQLLVESLLLAGGGALLGLAIAKPLSLALLAMFNTQSNPLELDVSVNWTVLTFAAAVGAATCFAFGLVPAFRASQLDPATAMKAGGRTLTTSRGLVVQRVLIGLEAALCVVLLFGAGLFVTSFNNLITTDTGFRREGLIVARLGDFSTPMPRERVVAAHRELLDRIRVEPQVQSAAFTTKAPLDSSGWTQGFLLPRTETVERRSSRFTYVSPQYFTTVGMRIIRGRDFDDTDTSTSKKVALVNESLVQRYFDGADPIGATLRTVAEPDYPETEYEIIGVVTDNRYSGVRELAQPITFVPLAQHPNPRGWRTLVIRASQSVAPTIAAVKDAVGELHPNMLTMFGVVEAQVRDGLVRERLLAWLSGGFGALAALLVMMGIYGVISYLVSCRRHEIAIRLALGAGRPRVVILMLRTMGGPLVVGVGIGAAVAAAAAQGASGLLFGLSPRDPVILTASIGLLTGAAVTACLIPALRASRLGATAALKEM